MPKQHSVEELTEWIKDLEKEEVRAIEEHGEGSREQREAATNLRVVRQKLDAAQYEEERRKEVDGLSAKEVVDRIAGR